MGTLTCTVEISKETGVTITTEDADEKLTQTIVMDGKSITMTVKGEESTSTITQTDGSVAISCGEFTVEAETVTVKAEKESVYESGEDHTITGDAVSVSANQAAEISGQEVAVSGQNAVELSGMEVTLEWTQSTEMSGTMVTVEAKGQLGLKATGAAELKGAATSVGGMVKLG